jgi:transposase
MIDHQKREAIYLLHNEGMSIRKIAKSLNVNRKTVRKIIEQKGQVPCTKRCDKKEPGDQLLIDLYNECEGYVQRIHEKLEEEKGIQIGYSTLTRKIRELELGKPKNKRCEQVEDKVGEEMQHDTTTYKIKLGDKSVILVASIIYLRYSKIRYLRFYRSFNRFTMKCFIHEALSFWGYCAPICIIDNTNLARLHGTGKNAVIVPEMKEFARNYGFEFICHEKGHANRKAGNERSFFTVETNFFSGRKFENLDDINNQGFIWATEKFANRPVSKTRLIPARAFEYEKNFLTKLAPYITPPYIELMRSIDQYGYVSVNGNYYWVPGIKRFEVKVLQFSDQIKIYHQREMLIKYDLAPEWIKNKKYCPPDQPKPKRKRDRKKNTETEEKMLRSRSNKINNYLDFAIKTKVGKKKHFFIQRLYRLFKNLTPVLFEKTISRALTYRIDDIETIERIAELQMKEARYSMPLPCIDESFKSRAAFIEGRFSEDVDLTKYKNKEEDNNE